MLVADTPLQSQDSAMVTLSAASSPVHAPVKPGHGTETVIGRRATVLRTPIRAVQNSGTRLGLEPPATNWGPAPNAAGHFQDSQNSPHKRFKLLVCNAVEAGATTSNKHSTSSTMYQKLGGAPAIQGVVDEFYTRVFADDEVNGFFEGINKQRLNRHQVHCWQATATLLPECT